MIGIDGIEIKIGDYVDIRNDARTLTGYGKVLEIDDTTRCLLIELDHGADQAKTSSWFEHRFVHLAVVRMPRAGPPRAAFEIGDKVQTVWMPERRWGIVQEIVSADQVLVECEPLPGEQTTSKVVYHIDNLMPFIPGVRVGGAGGGGGGGGSIATPPPVPAAARVWQTDVDEPAEPDPPADNPVHSPSHYTSDAPFESIDVLNDLARRLARGGVPADAICNFFVAVKYLERAGSKEGQPALQDLEKSSWYMQMGLHLMAPEKNPDPRQVKWPLARKS